MIAVVIGGDGGAPGAAKTLTGLISAVLHDRSRYEGGVLIPWRALSVRLAEHRTRLEPVEGLV